MKNSNFCNYFSNLGSTQKALYPKNPPVFSSKRGKNWIYSLVYNASKTPTADRPQRKWSVFPITSDIKPARYHIQALFEKDRINISIIFQL